MTNNPNGYEMTDYQKMWHKRLDTSFIDVQKLVNVLLTQVWQHHCIIIKDYMPPYGNPNTPSKCVVAATNEEGETRYLRYSKGPLQGYTWDCYGDDMLSPELAIVALSQAHAPLVKNALQRMDAIKREIGLGQ